jgi:hypothetical protein
MSCMYTNDKLIVCKGFFLFCFWFKYFRKVSRTWRWKTLFPPKPVTSVLGMIFHTQYKGEVADYKWIAWNGNKGMEALPEHLSHFPLFFLDPWNISMVYSDRHLPSILTQAIYFLCFSADDIYTILNNKYQFGIKGSSFYVFRKS